MPGKAKPQPRPGLPWMPGYLKDEARPDPEKWAWARERMTAARGYWIGSTSPDGSPHMMPVWGVYLDDAVWFSTSRGSKKGRNLASDPRVALHLDDTDNVVVVEGIAEEVPAGDSRFPEYAAAYHAKYAIQPGPSNDRDVVYQVRPRVAFTWRESDFADRATRWRFE